MIMEQEFSRQFMRDNCGCYSKQQLNRCSFMNNELISLISILESEIPLRDKYWFVCKKLATKRENQEIAIGVAEIVLPIYEEKYPDDSRPKESIEAAKLYIKGYISLNELMNKRRAAAAAHAAANAAYAAHAAAYAAYASYAAAHAATYANAAYAAHDAAYTAADAADSFYEKKLLEFLIEYAKNI